MRCFPNLYIFGAGFTRAVFPDAPLNADLLTKIVGPTPDTSFLGRLWSTYRTTDIEKLLTQFDLDSSVEDDHYKIEVRDGVSAQIAEYFEQFRFDTDVHWLQPLLRILSNNDVIVSLNYDCFLEGFLDHHRAWSPKGGYDLIQNPMDESLPANDRNIRILKIHGSESFRLSPVLDRREWAVVGVGIDSSLFPRSGENRQLGGGIASKPYLIAPSFTKQFGVELESLMLKAIRSARTARNLVIIGCGLRREDSYLWLILTSFMSCPRWKSKRTIIVSPSASLSKERISRFWSRGIFTERNLISIDSGLQEALPTLTDLLRG